MPPSNAIAAIRSLIEQERDALEHELGIFALEDDEVHREVVMTLVDDEFKQQFRCYETAGRLVVDDFFPSEEERANPSPIEDQGR